MKTLRTKQTGFAMPAMFVAVAIAFIGSLNVEGKDGMTVAEAMRIDHPEQSEFATVEPLHVADSPWIDE